MRVSDDMQFVLWGDSKTRVSNQMEVADIVAVHAGHETLTFKKKGSAGAAFPVQCCFSLEARDR